MMKRKSAMRTTPLTIVLLAALLSGCATSLPGTVGWNAAETGQTSLPLPPAPPAPEPILATVSQPPAPRATRPTPVRRTPIAARVKRLECSQARIEGGTRYKTVCR
jgi:hypothetical protein